MSPELLDRILKLLGMTSSSNANEAGVAAVQLNRTLKAHGLDIHDLAAAVAAGFNEKSRSNTAPDDDCDDDDDDDMDWQHIIKTCLKHQHKLNPKSREFLDTMKG
jgi:hypothetical protein